MFAADLPFFVVSALTGFAPATVIDTPGVHIRIGGSERNLKRRLHFVCCSSAAHRIWPLSFRVFSPTPHWLFLSFRLFIGRRLAQIVSTSGELW